MRIIVGVLVLAMAGFAPLSAQDFEWSGRLARGRTIEIQGINGGVEARLAPAGDVVVTAVKEEGRRGDADDVRIEVVEHDDGVTVCAVYPSRRRRPNECRPGGSDQNVRDNDTEVFFTVLVPAGVHFAAETVNGDIDARDLEGDVTARTVNGGIDVSGSGSAEASTVNGSITASLQRGDWSNDLEFRTVNGSIAVELPDDVGAVVTAETVNGGIETDFPLTVRGRFSTRRLTGTIGDGGRRLVLHTVNGRIQLRRRGSGG